ARQGRFQRLEHGPIDVGLLESRALLRFGQPDHSDFGIGEHRRRHIAVIDDSGLAAEHRVGERGTLADGDRREIDAVSGVAVDEYSRATVPNIYAIGDVTNRINLTP